MINLIVVELVVGAVAGLTFVLIYWRRNWRGTTMGRHWMAVAVITTGEFVSLALLGLGVPVPRWLFAVGFALLDALLIQRVWLLLRAEHEKPDALTQSSIDHEGRNRS